MASRLHPMRRGRRGIVAVLIVSLLASAATRYLADAKRQAAIPNRGEVGSGTSLSAMNSFALGLLLGGLRGPLVMLLWTNSESQKSQKNLEGVDTQIEWIRLLQPEFDTVHIFQIWNKAYNISVQMASRANKYSVILDAIDYAKSVDREKPEDINIVSAIAQIYFDKLGNSAEKSYYRRRVRKESLPHSSNQALRRQDPGWRRSNLDAMLDDHFNLLPNLIAPLPGRHLPVDPHEEYNDGSDLQYLEKYEPFPDGISTFGLAYNYDKRAEVLMNVGKQRHAQLSDLVIDSRPALALKNWTEEEWEQALRRELEAFGMPAAEDRPSMQPITADFGPDHPITDRHAAELAVFEFDRADHLVADADAEYVRHITNDPTNEANYRSHMDELNADAEICAADRDYLSAQLSPPDKRESLLASAREHYIRSVFLFEVVILKYYTDTQYVNPALPPGFSRFRMTDRKGIEDLSPPQLDAILGAIKQTQLNKGYHDSHSDDQAEYMQSIGRALIRLRHLPAEHN